MEIKPVGAVISVIMVSQFQVFADPVPETA
jgi:hypothetical protein